MNALCLSSCFLGDCWSGNWINTDVGSMREPGNVIVLIVLVEVYRY